MTIRTIKPSLHWSNPAVERVLYFYGFNRTTNSLMCSGYWKKTRRESNP